MLARSDRRNRLGEALKLERQQMLLDAVADERLQDNIGGLVDGRARDVKLTGDLRRLYNQYTWEGRAKAARGWLIAVTILGPPVVFIDWALDPGLLWPAILLRGLFMPLVGAAVLLAWRKPVAAWVEGVSITVFVAALMAMAGALGQVAGGMIYERYLMCGLFVVSTGIVIVPLELRWTVVVALVTCGLHLGFQLHDPIIATIPAVLSTLFFSIAMGALVLARRVAATTHQRGVLMRFRDAYQAARLAEANRELYRLATTDGLTGLLNRRSISETLHQAFLRYETLSIAILDIDHFKQLNDTLGHPEGDRCLRLVAETLTGAIRADCDGLGRFGGEEFLLVLPDTDVLGAACAGERFRSAIEALHFNNPGAHSYPWVTVSIGLATTSAADRAPDIAALLRMADEALYEAKRGGRNRVRSYEAVTWLETTDTVPLPA